MGFVLLDNPNPYGQHYYSTRRRRLLAIVMHATAGAEDLDTIADLSAENVAHYAATTDREVSWHTGSDTDSWVDLLPSSYTAWHATDYNSCTHGHEMSKRHMDWRVMPALWIQKTLRMAALGPDGLSGLRKVALENNIPLRWATKAELDHALATDGEPVGFITHAELQWSDRRDPGYVTEDGRTFDTFPRAEFMALLNQEDDMPTLEEITNAVTNGVFGRLVPLVQYGGGRVPVSFQGAVEYLDYRTQSTNAAVSAIAKQLDAQAVVLRQIAENDDHITLDPVDMQTLTSGVRAELDEIAAAHQRVLEEFVDQFEARIDELAEQLENQPAASIRASLREFLLPSMDAAAEPTT
jgi:hypothetical protein